VALIREIVADLGPGETRRMVARAFAISPSHLSGIVNGRFWATTRAYEPVPGTQKRADDR
jgi:hypothetical protein